MSDRELLILILGILLGALLVLAGADLLGLLLLIALVVVVVLMVGAPLRRR